MRYAWFFKIHIYIYTLVDIHIYICILLVYILFSANFFFTLKGLRSSEKIT